ncbi:hypothetical protein Clacol_005987 [Clathrus columnatus]|uniref:Major facilitator superfamily (MFS) profile domain-containing protein n=1 Tax=Clathrus columnatus TaxID=1419009 RepID=A0AAV5AEY8_9AGAM|nr:hypothetical protein Clacol_005987 [Clathrus columnatus]
MSSENEKENVEHEEEFKNASYEDDPMSWSKWRKNGLLAVVGLHTMQAPFSASIFISPPLSLGACTVREVFSPQERGEKMGLWSLMVSIGPLLGPILVGFLVQNCGWRAAFDLTAAMQLALFFAHLFFGPETLRYKSTDSQESSTQNRPRKKFAFFFQVYSHEPIRFEEFLRPFFIGFKFPTVFFPAFANALVFCYANVFVTVFVPKIFGKKFGLSPGQIGLQIIAQFIGAILGETLAGRGSDAFMNWRTRKTGNRVPEYRLFLVYPVWGVQLQNAQTGHWNITPASDIGAAITIFGQQIVSSICTTYAIETYLEQTGHVSSFVSFLRQLWGFLGPFYLGDAVDNLGTAKACGVFAVLMAIGGFTVGLCHFFGTRRWNPAYVE